MLGVIYSSYAQTYSGSDSCRSCHQTEFNQWQQSHHRHAMEKATEQTVLGDFNNSEFSYNGITSRFYKKDGKFFVLTDNAKGELEEFQISYTFGYYPLQQYLVDFADGRKQVLQIIWDSRSKAEGGQRWYHLYPEHPSLTHAGDDTNPIDAEHPLHWTGSYFNWNSRCASCHSTELKKNYAKANNHYSTHWFEIDVGCEACHGPASEHIGWAEGDHKTAKRNKGFDISLKDEGIWRAIEKVANGQKTPHHTLKRSGPSAKKQHQTCASCHARRSELKAAEPYKKFHQQYNLRLLETPLYYADGQIRDEVYVYGSFLQSKMHAEGVTCSNCHNPHSLQLKAGNRDNSNPVCLQCHRADVFDSDKHHHHPQGSSGAQCVNCHMPSTTYMGVDKRRDHSLRIPHPELSEKIQSPNACNQCHTTQSNQWAAKSIQSWLKQANKTASTTPYAEAFYRADQGDTGSTDELLAIGQNTNLPEIVRASAITRLSTAHNQQSIVAVAKWLASDAPLIRRAATTSLAGLPVSLRYQLLGPHLHEPMLSVRLEIARILADVPIYQLADTEAKALQSLFDDFLQSAEYNADSPEGQTLLGSFYIAQQDYPKAKHAYRQALKIAPNYEAALLNLADYYRANGQDDKALPLLQKAIASAPQSANAHYALGLLYIRQQKLDNACASLKQASLLDNQNSRFAITYALALKKNQQAPAARQYLQQWLKNHGSHPIIEQTLGGL